MVEFKRKDDLELRERIAEPKTVLGTKNKYIDLLTLLNT